MKNIILKAVGFFALSVAFAAAADEITVNVLLDVQNGNFALRRQISNYKVTQAGTAADYGIQSVPINTTNNLNVFNVATPGYVFLRNLSTNNTIYVTCTIQLSSNDVGGVNEHDHVHAGRHEQSRILD